ncbi:aquaporin-11 [Sceloporus undulatus]|uniref:aquaporin-11 n=1 Tax=Sceloporus undulatus TaxID=8520 RepID=UPI001C4AA989|nr:aquaporin-11 [Sceloporus undulatus]
MALLEACLSLLVMALTVVGITACRRVALQALPHRPQSQGFFLELSGAFQIAACTHELRLMAELPPQPHLALALTYLLTALHGLTLLGSLNNPSSSFQLFFKGRLTAKTWGLQTAAHFAGALLANIYIRLIWTLGMAPVHSRALAESCTSPIQTTLANAFVLELLFSFLLHLTLLQVESMNHKTKSHLVALLITTLVYEGGHLTGAIFNPALAFSMHLSCFSEKFWNYILVYWIAPCIGSVLVVIAWDEILPLIRREA